MDEHHKTPYAARCRLFRMTLKRVFYWVTPGMNTTCSAGISNSSTLQTQYSRRKKQAKFLRRIGFAEILAGFSLKTVNWLLYRLIQRTASSRCFGLPDRASYSRISYYRTGSPLHDTEDGSLRAQLPSINTFPRRHPTPKDRTRVGFRGILNTLWYTSLSFCDQAKSK
jgi:hypothetical protein